MHYCKFVDETFHVVGHVRPRAPWKLLTPNPIV